LLERYFETYKSLELGPLAVLRKSDGVLIGRCGLGDMALEVNTSSGELPRVWYQRSQVPSDTNVIFEQELGYTFDRIYWSQGYASEAAARVFEYASSTIPFRRIVSVIHPHNTPSIKIAKKCGARHENNVMLMGQEFLRFVWPGGSASPARV
jgi:RimJ/RimL family protein N-acetyltransferase